MAIEERRDAGTAREFIREAWQSYKDNREQVFADATGPTTWLGPEGTVIRPLASQDVLHAPKPVDYFKLRGDLKGAAIELGYARESIISGDDRRLWDDASDEERHLARIAFLNYILDAE